MPTLMVEVITCTCGGGSACLSGESADVVDAHRPVLAPGAGGGLGDERRLDAVVEGARRGAAAGHDLGDSSARKASAKRSRKKSHGVPVGKATPGSADRSGRRSSSPAATESLLPSSSRRTSWPRPL